MCTYSRFLDVTKSDTANFDGSTTAAGTQPANGVIPCDALYCGGAGVVAGVAQDGTVHNFTVVAGEILPFRLVRVNNTNTTATLMVACYHN